jgi:bla regulator protein BlaR1
MSNLVELWRDWILNASWQLALLVILVAAIASLARRLSARYRYLLWLLVLVKVFLPPSLSFVYGIGEWGVSPFLAAVESSVEIPPNVSPARAFRADTPTSSPSSRSPQTSPSTFTPAPVESRWTGAVEVERWKWIVDPVALFFFVWIAGIGIFALAVGLRYAHLLKSLRSSTLVCEGPLRIELERLSVALGKKALLDLWISPHIQSPFLCGLLRPRIVLPESCVEKLSAEEVRNVLLHELVHWKNYDLAICWIQSLAQALFWFHPFVWYANARIRHEREAACDEAVIALGECSPDGYGESLLKVLLAAKARSATSLGFLGIFERGARLQERLEGIMNYQPRSRKSGLLIGGALVLLVAVLLPMSPMAEETSNEEIQTYVVAFRPVEPFIPQDSEALLAAFNENHPAGVRTHHFSTTSQSGIWIGYIHVDGEEGRDRVLAMLEESAKLTLVQASKAPQAPVVQGGESGTPVERILEHPDKIVLKHDDGEPDGRQSYGGGVGHAVLFEAPDETYALVGVELYGSRYGESRPPDEDFTIELVKPDNNATFATVDKPYAHFERGDPKWVGMTLDNVPVPKSFWVVINFNAHQTKGVYVSYDTSNERSYSKQVEWKNQFFGLKFDPKANWMIRAHVLPDTRLLRARDPVKPGSPQITRMIPPNNAPNVDPNLKELRVTFDRPMAGGFSWCGSGEHFPPTPPGQKAYWTEDKMTCVRPVRLKPGWSYTQGINCPSANNFRSAEGRPAEVTWYRFETMAYTGAPEVLEIDPPHGAENVDPSLKEIRVTFNMDMDKGFSWCGSGEHYPTVPEGEGAYWTEDGRTCVLPVQLKSNWRYEMGINCPSFQNFRSAQGEPFEPMSYSFKTRSATQSIQEADKS